MAFIAASPGALGAESTDVAIPLAAVDRDLSGETPVERSPAPTTLKFSSELAEPVKPESGASEGHDAPGGVEPATPSSNLDTLQTILPKVWSENPQVLHAEEVRSEEHSSELPSLMRYSYVVFVW